MELIIEQLNHKYNKTLETLKERRLLSYLESIYGYFDIIEGNIDINEMVEDDRKKIEGRKKEIGSNLNISEKEKKDTLNIIRKNSVSYCHNVLYEKIYVPIKEYKESYNPTSKNSQIGKAISIKELNTTPGEDITDAILSPIFGNTEPAKSFWTKLRYKFSMDEFALCRKTLDGAVVRKLLDSLNKKKESLPVKESSKIQIIIDDKKGIYRADDENHIYSVENKSKRMKLIKHLISKDNCSVSELMDITHQDKGVVIKSVQEINKKFRENLQLTHDLIKHFQASGYSLNKDIFDIEIK
jgi:hypothetical protein